MADGDQSNLTNLTVDLLSAYVANNNVQHGDLAELIKSTHAALKVIDSPEAPPPVEPEHTPAVSVRKSLASRTHIISMIDGKPYQTLRRHLKKHGLTDKQYRERYSLPGDYPMVAPAYSENRREIAQRLGLGRKSAGAPTPPAASAKPPVQEKEVPAKPRAAAPKVSKARQAPVKSANAAVPATKRAKAAPKTKQATSPKAAEPPKPDAAPATKSRSARKPVKAAAPLPEPSPIAAKPAAKKRAPKAASTAKAVS